MIYEPARQARRMFMRENHWQEWSDFTDLYATFPRLIVDTTTMFFAGRPILWSERHLLAWKEWPVEACDTWYCEYLVGKLADVWDYAPFDLENIVYKRAKNQSLHFCRFSRLKSLNLISVMANKHIA